MNINAYLNRLLYAGPVDTSLITLRKLHYHHLLTIPLENLSIHYGEAIILEPDALFTKIVQHKRGGFCYELNGLFYELLRAIGFQVRRISGRVYDPEKGFNAEFDHLAIIAHVDGIDWLVDVGFGRRFPFYPMPLRLNLIQSDASGRYLLKEYDANYFAINQRDSTGEWIPAYLFTRTARELSDFASMCHFHQTSADSYFTQNKLCTIALTHGRVTLTDSALKITSNNQLINKAVRDKPEFEHLLYQYFGIQMAQPDVLV
ncbi:arylamine N-acetyltransferase [Spirosoma sp. RP8]|uniref:Arylamine N-acetyltransferase n=1 Tax=Spirosoma liriopis TaxID=2937440 RepID=A0ABT0HQM0_9BACT|nr:arylamine N-acetyltransferase [Spirosoma liriopis]MCK8494275.1 arylamine N-acetyltransferase [Spirosoma liriopis]